MNRFVVRVIALLIAFSLGIVTVWSVLYFQLFFRDKVEEIPPQYAFNCFSPETPKLCYARGEIDESVKSLWKWNETRVSGGEDLSVVQFINSNEGWVGGSKGSLYKTTDTGRAWQKVNIDAPLDSSITSISFINSSVGWVIASVRGDIWMDIKSVKGAIFKTTDGGQSWQVQYKRDALDASKVLFVNEQEGWAIGSSISEPSDYKNFIIHTTDGGKHWEDISANISVEGLGTNQIVDIIADKPSKALILKSSGGYSGFYLTKNGGKSWQKVFSHPHESEQAFLGSKGLGFLPNKKMWAASGTGSEEGTWSTVGQMDPDGTWTLHTIFGVCFFDAKFISDNQVIAGGTIHPFDLEAGNDRGGLIWGSQDGGRNWNVIYSSDSTTIYGLTNTDSNNVWAVGSHGYIVYLQPTS